MGIPSPPTSSFRARPRMPPRRPRCPGTYAGARPLFTSIAARGCCPARQDEVDLAVPSAPPGQLDHTRRGRVGEVRADRGLDQAPPRLAGPARGSQARPDWAVIRAVLSTWSLGLEPRLRRTLPGELRKARQQTRAGEQTRGSGRGSWCSRRRGAGRASSCTRAPGPSNGSRARTAAAGGPACPPGSTAARPD